jgi:5-methylcytosine-specific restriction endonuclease McrA
MSKPKDPVKAKIWKEKQSISHKGQIAWNKGKRDIYSEETKKKLREATLRMWKNSEYRTKNKTSKGKKFSEEFKKRKSKLWKGNRNPNWKGGITSENDQIRKSEEYKIWRDAVYKRDCFTCRICGNKCSSKNIVAHHLLSFSDYIHLRFAIDNGMTLCRNCHLRLHNQLNNGEAMF